MVLILTNDDGCVYISRLILVKTPNCSNTKRRDLFLLELALNNNACVQLK